MPLVRIAINPRKVFPGWVGKLCEVLAVTVSDALSTNDGGTLRPEDVMIEVSQVEHDLFSRNLKDCGVMIYAHDYPERRANLDERRRKIALEVVKYLPAGASWFVWVWLGTTSYGSDTQR